MNVIFPWPPAKLSPNARVHHMAKYKVNKAYRAECCLVAKAAKLTPGMNISVFFVPPDRRRRDLDNCIASCKALFDGLADAMGVNDNQFKITAQLAQNLTAPNGEVRVSVT